MGLWCSIMLRLLAASSEFPNGAHALIALDPLRLPIRNSDVLSTSLQAQAALANPPHDHLLGIRISHAKFRANLLKTVAIHKKQKTDTHTDIRLHTYKIPVLVQMHAAHSRRMSIECEDTLTSISIPHLDSAIC